MTRLPDLPHKRTIADVISSMRSPTPGADTAWYKVGPSEAHGINFENYWVNATLATAAPAGWHLSEDGQVRLRGRVRNSGGYGADETTIFTLPPELRPEFDAYFVVDTDDPQEFSLDVIKFRAFELGDA